MEKKQSLKTLFSCIVILLIFPVFAFAGSVILEWEANSETDLAQYRVYYGTFSRDYKPFIPVGNVTTYTMTDLEDGETYYFALTAVDTSGNESGYSAEAVYTVPFGRDIDPPPPASITDGLVGAWMMTEGSGTLVADAGGKGNDGTLGKNGTSPVPAWISDGTYGNTVRLTGAGWNDAGKGSYIDLGHFNITGDQMTMGIMFKMNDLEPYDGRLISKQKAQYDNDHFWMLSRYSNNSLRFRLKAGGSVTKLVSSQSNLYSAGQWVFAVATYDGSAMKIYCNGNLVGSTSKTGNVDNSSDYKTYIGVGQIGSNLYTSFNGDVAFAFMYERALTEDEINLFYQKGKQVLTSGTPADTAAPSVTILSPTSNETYATAEATVKLEGTSSDNIGVTQVQWGNSLGGNGTASGTTSWSVASIALKEGANVITVTAFDAAGNEQTDKLTVTYEPPDTIPPVLEIIAPTTADAFETECVFN
jgi:hypothetical protein